MTGATASSISRSNTTERRNQLVQNYLLIWVDANIDPKNEDCGNTLTQLRGVVRKVDLCKTPAECIDFLNKLNDEKAFVISSGALGQQLVSDIHDMTQVRAIYIFCGNKARHEAWANKWPKIQGVFTAIKPICASLKKVVRDCDHDTISMSFVPKRKPSATTSTEENLNELPPSFMYSILFKEIALEIDAEDNKALNDLVEYCLKKDISEQELDFFQTNYHQKTPVWWYSCENFLYPMLNHALRSLDTGIMVKLVFFMRSLHLQLQGLHKKQSDTYKEPFVVYRGQGLSQEDFQHLYDSIGGLLSFNNFLSTSTERKTAMGFLDRSLEKCRENVGILFIMNIDPRKISSTTSTPFAFIDDYSAMEVKEKEILFSMHTIFHVGKIKQTSDNSRLWEVQLTLTEDNDPQLTDLTKYMKRELHGPIGWYRLGKLMIKVGHFDQAEELYTQLLENASNDNEKANIYYQLGWLKIEQKDYKTALEFYEESLKIKRKTVPEDDRSLSALYNDIAVVYRNMSEYSKALEFFEKSLAIRKKTLSPDHPGLAISYNNIGLLYKEMNKYSEALACCEKALKIEEKTLPSNHPSLAISYHNIGTIYSYKGEYTMALQFFEEALAIEQKSLPPTHPSIKTTMNNIVYVKTKL